MSVEIKKHEPGMVEIIADGIQLQTIIDKPNNTLRKHSFSISLNGPIVGYDMESGTGGLGIDMNRECVKTLLNACIDFLMLT